MGTPAWLTFGTPWPKDSPVGCHRARPRLGTRLTCADDAGVLVVAAVVGEPAAVQAPPECALGPHALHVVQGDGALASAEMRPPGGRHSLAAGQLPAHHLGIAQVPAVVTHGPPAAIVVQLHAALAPVTAIGQPEGHPWKGRHPSPQWALPLGTALEEDWRPL